MAEQNLRKLLEEIAKEHGYSNPFIEIKAISSGGANYTSTLYLATISSQVKDDLKLFAKVSQLSDSLRSSSMMDQIFEIEDYFYNDLLKTYEDLEEKNNVPKEHRIIKPKYYGGHNKRLEEILVLEDLTAKGFKSHDRKKGFNWEYASKAVEGMAKFHALSFAYQWNQPEKFKEIEKKYTFESVVQNEHAKLFYKKMIDSAFGVIKEEYLPNVKKFFEDDNIIEKCLQMYLPKNRPVLVHGDFKTSNLMHRRRNGKLEIIPVDYQTLHTGPPLADFFYLVFTGSDQHFRKLYYNLLIEHYYTQLSLYLKRLNLDVQEVYPRDEFDADVKEEQIYGLIIGMTVLSVITVEEEDAPRMENGTGMEDFASKPSATYAERLNGIVEDYIRWGII